MAGRDTGFIIHASDLRKVQKTRDQNGGTYYPPMMGDDGVPVRVL